MRSQYVQTWVMYELGDKSRDLDKIVQRSIGLRAFEDLIFKSRICLAEIIGV